MGSFRNQENRILTVNAFLNILTDNPLDFLQNNETACLPRSSIFFFD